MQQWEYLTLLVFADAKREMEFLKKHFPDDGGFARHSPKSLMPWLNEYGEQGWELVSLTPVAAGENEDIQIHSSAGLQGSTKIWSAEYLAVFKRPKA